MAETGKGTVVAEAQQAFAAARLAPRPPRVAVVVPGGDHWDYWVRLAMFDASTRWGGAGYVLVPHLDGAVNGHLLEVLVTYDPDFVVELQPTLRQLEAAFPGDVPVRASEGRVLEGMERLKAIESVMDDPVSLRGSDIARDNVARVCTPHRQTIGDDQPSEHVEVLPVRGQDDNVPTCPQPLDPNGGLVTCPPDWSGSLAAATAAHVGAAAEPQPGAESALDVAEQRRLATMLLTAGVDRPDSEPPDVLVQASEPDTQSAPESALERTMMGLTRVTRGFQRDRSRLLVIGDTADDFALAMIWDRLYGTSVWFPSELQPTGHGPLSSAARIALSRQARSATRWDGSVHVASCSLGNETLGEMTRDWQLPDEFTAGQATQAKKKRRGGVVLGLPRPSNDGVTLVAVREQYDRYVNLPVAFDDEGTLQLPVPPPTVIPDEASLAAALPSSWQIDIEFTDERMPRGRGIDGASLVHDEDPRWDAWVRSGRDGLCVHSHRFGLVLAGSSLEATIAKPRVREHGLLPWVRQMARASGRTAEQSDAGRRAQIAERLFGGRERLIKVMASPLRTVLRHFRPEAPRTSDAYTDGHGVVLGDDGHLTYAGLEAAALGGLDTSELRGEIDQLLESGVLTRGLVLGCRGCRKPGFVAVDHLAQDNECPRCGEVSPLTQARWRQPYDEPVWHYRLHWSVAELFDQNGDVPLLLSHELRGKPRSRYTDIGEVEFAAGGTRVAECDLIALRRGQLLVAEAKTTDTLEANSSKRRRAADKRVKIAAALHADEIVLATTQASWQQSSIDAMSKAIVEHHWPTGRGPLLRLVTGLGGTPAQHAIDPH